MLYRDKNSIIFGMSVSENMYIAVVFPLAIPGIIKVKMWLLAVNDNKIRKKPQWWQDSNINDDDYNNVNLLSNNEVCVYIFD